MNPILKIALGAAAAAAASLASAEISFYENDNFSGRHFTVRYPIDDFRHIGYNDRASSVLVTNEPWEVCEDVAFRGRCILLRPGRYPSLRAMRLNDRISSARQIDPRDNYSEDRYAPPPPPQSDYDWHPRPQEELFQADVTAWHAVYGSPERHCWVDREQVRDNNNQVGGAVIGGILGGILGHQIAHGNGATVIGVVGGAAVGSAIGSNMDGSHVEQVQRCDASQVQGPPLYWDTVYTFRGQEHHVQTSGRPGPHITVNRDGEPRG